MGPLLALLTWVFAVVAIIVVGLIPLQLVRNCRLTPAAIRAALWLGLVVLVPTIVLAGEWLSLRSVGAAAVVAVPIVVGLVLLGVKRPRWAGSWIQLRRGPSVVLLIGLGVVAVYLAVAAMGQVTNYDSGLYHLGAIAYAGDYPALRGLANVYLALGYGNSHVALSAFAGNGPWSGEGYRLVNGLLLIMFVLDLALRLTSRRRSAGTYILSVAVPIVVVPMLALADYWVTSPTSDTAVMVLTLVSTCYLADALGGSRVTARDLAVALGVAVIAITMRPTMLIYTGAVILVIVAVVVRRRMWTRMSLVWIITGIAVVTGLLQALRDRRLSGWLGYPLGLLPFNVPWRASDPSANRLATLGVARDPANWQDATSGWGWVPAWLARQPTQWETWVILILAMLAVVCLAIAWRCLGRSALRLRGLVALVAPSSIAVVTWFLFLPPSFRFIWGPAFALVTAAIGWTLWRLNLRGIGVRALGAPLFIAAALVLIATSVVCGATRLHMADQQSRTFVLGPLRISYSASAIPMPATKDVVSAGGVTVRMPIQTDQCWSVYPLCTPVLESALRSRGPSINDGFTP